MPATSSIRPLRGHVGAKETKLLYEPTYSWDFGVHQTMFSPSTHFKSNLAIMMLYIHIVTGQQQPKQRAKLWKRRKRLLWFKGRFKNKWLTSRRKVSKHHPPSSMARSRASSFWMSSGASWTRKAVSCRCRTLYTVSQEFHIPI